MLGWLVDHGIDPHIPVWDKGKRDDGTFSREDFRYDPQEDRYICPNGRNLRQYRLAGPWRRQSRQKMASIAIEPAKAIVTAVT